MPKMSNKWIALCTTAVGVVYGAGYVVTQPTMAQTSTASAQPASAVPSQSDNNQFQHPSDGSNSSNSPNSYYGGRDGRTGHHHDFNGDGGFRDFNGSDNGGSFGQPNGGNSNNRSSPNTNNGSSSSSASSAHSGSSSSSSTSTYKNGTFQGTGMNRYGTVTVSVTIHTSKITNVQIVSCDTHYPEDAITGLPQEVINRQSANVDIVSGATGSSEDFQQAVAQALQNAQA